MIVAIHQPEHLPWLGFFDKARLADTFVLLDHVQYRRRYFQNRNRVYGPTGAQWITVPVVVKGRYTQAIDEVEIDNAGNPQWAEQCWSRLLHAYAKSPYFAEYRDWFETLYATPWTRLVDFNLAIIRRLLDALGVDVTLVRSSELGVGGQKSDLMLEICRRLGGRAYLSGISGRDYLDRARFRDAGIELHFQEFHHPVYRQRREPFLPCMSAVDLLFNHGSASAQILRGVGVEVMQDVFV
jgi:hypothetical protein